MNPEKKRAPQNMTAAMRMQLEEIGATREEIEGLEPLITPSRISAFQAATERAQASISELWLSSYRNSTPADPIEVAIKEAGELELNVTAAEILRGMAATHEERGREYGNNFDRVGDLMLAFFPEGVSPDLLRSPQYHGFQTIVAKLGRFAHSRLRHVDSIHDVGTYAAMIEAALRRKGITK